MVINLLFVCVISVIYMMYYLRLCNDFSKHFLQIIEVLNKMVFNARG